MNWLRDNRRDAAFILATLAIPVCLVLVLVFNLLGMRAEYGGEIDRLEPRVARLIGLMAREDALAEAAGRVDAELLSLVYPATDDTAAVSTTLQKNVRDIFADAGLSVANSQILPAEQDGLLEHITVKLTVTGSLAALDSSLTEVASYRPLLILESVDIYPMRGASARGKRPPQHVTANLQILALRQVQ